MSLPCATCEKPTKFVRDNYRSLLCCSRPCEQVWLDRIAKAVCSHCKLNVTIDSYFRDNAVELSINPPHEVKRDRLWINALEAWEASESKECELCEKSRGTVCPGACGRRAFVSRGGRVEMCGRCRRELDDPDRCRGCRRKRAEIRAEGHGLRRRGAVGAGSLCDPCFAKWQANRPEIEAPCSGGCGTSVKRIRGVKGMGWCSRCETTVIAISEQKGRVVDLLRRGGTEDAEVLVTWFERLSSLTFELAIRRGHPAGLK